jgi:hypothetical protein
MGVNERQQLAVGSWQKIPLVEICKLKTVNC